MPLIMDDDDHYMDDLFGDSNAISQQLSVPTAVPLVKGLLQRLDQLATTSCSQKVAWSRFGVIAAVNEHENGVNLLTFLRQVKSKAWRPSDPIPLVFPPLDFIQHSIAHIQWSKMGNALAVTNTVGHVYIFTQGFSPQGQLQPAKISSNTALTSSEDELGQIVGMHWLPLYPQQKQSGVYWSARWDGENFAYEYSHHVATGSYHPSEGKSAMICITRRGTLRFFYELSGNNWAETTADVKPAASSLDPAISHACFTQGNDNSSLILATYDASQQLRVYKVNVRWSQATDSKQKTQFSASLQVEASKVEKICLPEIVASPDYPNKSSDKLVTCDLTTLEIVPAAPDNKTDGSSFPTITAIFAVAQTLTSNAPDADHSQSFGVVCRWQIRDAQSTSLSACFESLTVKKKAVSAAGSRMYTRLERLPDTQLHCTVLAFEPTRYGTQLAFTMADGTIQFRDRESMEVISVDGSILGVDETRNLPDIKSMPQIGFVFPHLDAGLQTALSPNQCIVVLRKRDGTLDWKTAEYSLSPITSLKPADPRFSSIAVVLALQHSSAIMQYKTADDILAVFGDSETTELQLEFIEQCRRAIRANFDFITEEGAKQIPNLPRVSTHYKCLSLQNLLGTQSKGRRDLRGKVAWMTLNLRFSFLVLGNTLKSTEPLRPELASSLVGQLRYSLDLIVYIMQEIIELFFAIKERPEDLTFIQQTLVSTSNPTLHILLSSFSRTLLRMLAKPIRIGYMQAQDGAKKGKIPEVRNAFLKIMTIYRAAPLNIGAFESFLVEIDAVIKKGYEEAGLDERAKTQAENDLILRTTIHPCLAKAVKTIMTTTLTTLLDQSEPGTIHNYDIAWLGLTEDRRARQMQEKMTIDVVRKIPLTVLEKRSNVDAMDVSGAGAGNSNTSKGVVVKQCTRCLSVIEDIQPQTEAAVNLQAWVWQSMKNCVCYSNWAAV